MLKKIPRSDHIAAIIPCYTPVGDTTAIITTNGSQNAMTTRIQTVITNLARHHATDLITLKQKSARVTNHRILQPLPLAPGLTLCPIKLRSPLVSGDTTTGYINFHAVTSITVNNNKPYQSTITLTGGTELPVLWTPRTVKKHLQYAKLVLADTTYDPEIPPELFFRIHNVVVAFYHLLMIQQPLDPRHLTLFSPQSGDDLVVTKQSPLP